MHSGLIVPNSGRYQILLRRRTDGSTAAVKAEDARLSARLNEQVRAWKKPTAAQAAAGNYFKPRMQWNGLNIAIENPAGTVREGVDETGKAWRTVFQFAYGEVMGSKGVDGDPVDVFIGDNLNAKNVYIVRQMKRKAWDQFDEDKCFLGFDSIAAAKSAYLNHYDDRRFFGGIISMPVNEFVRKVMLADGKMLKAIPVIFLSRMPSRI